MFFISCSGQQTEKQTKDIINDNFISVSDSVKINEMVKYSFNAEFIVLEWITDINLLEKIYAPMGIQTDDYSKNGIKKALVEKKEKTFSEKKEDEWLKNWDSSDAWVLDLYDNIKMNVFSKTDTLLTILYSFETYEGGAHGSYGECYKIFDLKNNKQILLTNIIKNTKDKIWNEILMNKFIQQYDETKDMLLEDTISLNDNFFFDDKEITFVYNHYEITAYAAGIIFIQIPFYEIKNLLTDDFVEFVKKNTD